MNKLPKEIEDLMATVVKQAQEQLKAKGYKIKTAEIHLQSLSESQDKSLGELDHINKRTESLKPCPEIAPGIRLC